MTNRLSVKSKAQDQYKNIPLYVDLDGTLVRSDTLHDSCAALLKINPLFIFLIAFWLLSGKAVMKDKISRQIVPKPDSLPYNFELLNFLKNEKEKGRPIILATASNEKTAVAVAEYLGFFDAVLASSATLNLSGANKLKAIQQHCRNHPFAYAGDSRKDIPIWKEAAEVILVSHCRNLAPALKKNKLQPTLTFDSYEHPLSVLWEALRPHQWAKNLLIFVSLILGHKLLDPQLFLKAAIAFTAFSLCASASYLINDLMDLEADRQHISKRFRPFASGRLSVQSGLVGIIILLTGSAIFSLMLSTEFQITLGGYFLFTLSYSFKFKKIVLLDVTILSLLYTIRIIAGSVAIQVETTPWLMGFSIFLFSSLAFVKRYTELKVLKLENTKENIGRGYRLEDIDLLAVFGSVSGYIAVIIFALYINSPETLNLYKTPYVLWLICPLLIYWISRIWLIAHRGEMHEDPVVFTLRDNTSYLTGLIIVLILLLAI